MLRLPIYWKMRKFDKNFKNPRVADLPKNAVVVVLGGSHKRGMDARIVSDGVGAVAVIASGTSPKLQSYLAKGFIRDDRPKDTPQNAFYSAQTIKYQFPDRPVILISTKGHLYRASMLFEFYGITPTLYASERDRVSLWTEAGKYVRNWFSIRCGK